MVATLERREVDFYGARIVYEFAKKTFRNASTTTLLKFSYDSMYIDADMDKMFAYATTAMP